MADESTPRANFADLQTQVKSKILERIAENFKTGVTLAQSTQYTKSDGTNYGMYQKADSFTSLAGLWERVFPPGSVSPVIATNTVVPSPTRGPTGGGGG